LFGIWGIIGSNILGLGMACLTIFHVTKITSE
jgi:hypothetical protein